MSPEFAPTPGQRAVITAPLGPMLVSAGAGTGKTTVMAQRILHLLESGQARAPEILALTFTNKAAANLKEKVRTTLAPGAPAEDPEHLDVFVTTYHSFGAGLVADHGGLIGLRPTTRVLDRAQARQLLYAVLDDLSFEHRSVVYPNVAIDAALDLADRCANRLVDVADVIADSHRLIQRSKHKKVVAAAQARLELCQLASAYHQRKRACELIDYGDQVALAVELMSRHPELARAYRGLHPVVLLDEYQDTNLAQRQLLELIYPPGSAVCAVGDDMQSIYAFRGAHRENILGFHRHFGPPVAPELANLEITFRFGPRLVELANRLQGRVADALPKRLEVPDRGEVVDTAIECFLAGDAEEEAATIAADIAGAGAPWSANAILCRKRRLIPAVVDALLAAGVPVEVAGGSGLLERPEVIEVLATLQLLADPGDTVAFLRLALGTRFALALGDVAALARHARNRAGGGTEMGHDPRTEVSLLASARHPEQVPDLSAEARARLEELTAGLDQLADLATRLPLPDLVEQVIERGRLWQAGGERGRENLLRLVAMAEEFEPVEGRAGLAELVEYSQILADTGEAVAEATDVATDAVRVLTVHQAKGLEFDSVFVPGLAGSKSSQIFPDSRADNPTSNAAAVGWWLTGNDEGLPDPLTNPMQKIIDELKRRRLDEEWRLLYVACTRARHKLVVSAAHWYLATDLSRTREPQGPSDFYEFIAAQDDLVQERFRRPAPAAGPDPDQAPRPAPAYRAPVGTDGQQLSLGGLDEPPEPSHPAPPARLSVTGLVTYKRCPRQFLWSFVRPLPRRVRASAALGAEVHRWIQRRADPQLVLVEEDSASGRPAPGTTGELQQSFLSSAYADLDPTRVEVAVAVELGGQRIQGRVDAVYERDGVTEIVDFKTGRAPEGQDMDDDVAMQLRLYGIAACHGWGTDPERLRLSACHLRPGRPAVVRSVDWDRPQLAEAEAEVGRVVESIAAASYRAQPGSRCRGCDFLSVCQEGRAWVYESR